MPAETKNFPILIASDIFIPEIVRIIDQFLHRNKNLAEKESSTVSTNGVVFAENFGRSLDLYK